MSAYTYVIVGGGIAGGKAAEAIRKLDPVGSLALVAGEAHPPYERPPLSKDYLLGKVGLDHVYLRDESFYAQNNIELLRGVRAVALHPSTRQLTLADGRRLGYERLLLATGGRPRRPALPGSELAGAFTLRAIEDADDILRRAQPGAPALVVGGSFIGCETAAALAQRGLRVTLAFPGSRCLQRIAPAALSDLLHSKYAAHGVRLASGRRLARLEGASQVERAILDDGETLPVTLVIFGLGIDLEVELARDAGLAQTDTGAIIVDEFLRTSAPAVFAAGDIAAWPDPTFGRRLQIEHWDVARRQGTRAGRNMAGDMKPYTDLPYFYSDLFDLSFEVWGDLSGWETTVRRGDPARGGFAFYYFAENRLCGVLSAGRPDGERKLMPALVKGRPAYADVAERLADEGTDLNVLLSAGEGRA